MGACLSGATSGVAIEGPASDGLEGATYRVRVALGEHISGKGLGEHISGGLAPSMIAYLTQASKGRP